MKNIKLLKNLENYISKFRKEDTKNSKELGVNFKLLTYGTTPYKTFYNLISHTSIKPKRFIVVGCSIGWMNFYWNDLYPNVETIGIDIHPYRIKYGNKLIKVYELNNIILKTLSVYDFEIKSGDLIWQSNLCFPLEEIKKLNKNIIKNTSNIGIISYKPIAGPEYSSKISSYKYPVSWLKNQTFYVYEEL